MTLFTSRKIKQADAYFPSFLTSVHPRDLHLLSHIQNLIQTLKPKRVLQRAMAVKKVLMMAELAELKIMNWDQGVSRMGIVMMKAKV